MPLGSDTEVTGCVSDHEQSRWCHFLQVQGAWDWNLKRSVARVAAVLDGWGKKYLVGIEILIQAGVLVSPRLTAWAVGYAWA